MLNLDGGYCCNIKENLDPVMVDKDTGKPIPSKTKPDCYLVRCKCFHSDYVPITLYDGVKIGDKMPDSEVAQAR